MCGLVMLLPHGYEGQGPEHSSARLERYLQLCAEQNMQVCVPSTPAQVYHMVSSLEELANGTFLPAIGEIDELDPKGVKRVVMCSGKVYYDLLEQRRKNNQHDVAIVRIEQLYPFPHKAMQEVLQHSLSSGSSHILPGYMKHGYKVYVGYLRCFLKLPMPRSDR